nr:PREDICTED: kinase D-interacting substrate of 220 kDa-like isoform X3 [Bemisia tabaci]
MAAADTREGGSEPDSQSEEAPPGERVDEEQGGATPSAEDAEAAAAKKPRRFSFLHLHIGERPFGIGGAHAAASAPTPVGSRHRHRRWSEAVFSVVSSHLPTFTFTGADDDSVSTSHSLGNHRRFSFANLRKFSGTVSLSSNLYGSDSMVSLCYRSLTNYIAEDRLDDFKRFIESKSVNVNDRDENEATALHYAASTGKSAFVRELISHGADVNAADNDNWTPLHCAAKEGYKDIVTELLEHGAKVDDRDMGGWTPLMWASYKGHYDTVVILLERNADVNAHGNYHISSLLWAAGRGHTDIAKLLLKRGAKVNVGDKYGTTALVWASRKGNVDIVSELMKYGANVDTAGMYSWTPLLVATMNNHVEVVAQLLQGKPNINALDKDGCTALTIACKEGFHAIASALINAGAYINIQDRGGDTNLIHAVKGNHRSIVESLLKKYADVDTPGKDRKTAVYTAVEKGNIGILKMLLGANPDLEIATKDGDTPLLRAVRIRNAECVQLLLEKKAKVTACDKRGDTALHIAMRARSKTIVEILLRNPRNSQLLYRPNKAGETPYNIDMNHQRTILGQIFGSRRLNTNEDNENLLGYDLYSSALADMLSEPSLSMPITVGLYAKWGSGKSFLLSKLREEMLNFARQWVEPVSEFSWLCLVLITHAAIASGVCIGVMFQSWVYGLATVVTIVFVTYVFLVFVGSGAIRLDWLWPYNVNVFLTKKMNSLLLILQVIFCHPPGSQNVDDSITAQPVKFYFTDQTRISSTAQGENTLVQMIGSLYDSIEKDYGSISTRLYRAFRPKPFKSTSSWKWRRLCCAPNIIVFEACIFCFLLGGSVFTVYLMEKELTEQGRSIDKFVSQVIMGLCITFLALGIVSNLYTWSRVMQSLVFSLRRQLQRSISKLESLKSEGFLQVLRSEVYLMTDLVKCLDSFTQQQTRLVIVVDGLDSCEQDKVLMILDAVHVLFSDPNHPFIIILAIDPHIISKAVESSSKRLFNESNIGGHEYLRNMVHLPFYLQNSGLRKVKSAQKAAMYHRKSVTTGPYEEQGNLVRSISTRRLSTESGMSSCEKLKLPSSSVSRGKNSRGGKLKLSESIASSIGSNINRVGGAQDLTRMLLTDDYFSDVNPRSMRRLMNVVYVTGRLMKAFHLDFNWYHLASWINITEQWPCRTSWLILYHEFCEDLDDNMSLKSLYDKVRPQIPVCKEMESLVELDRDEKKFDVFLTFHRNSLLVGDLRIFLPFTINLDPFIKKVIKGIKEDQQYFAEANLLASGSGSRPTVPPGVISPWVPPEGQASADVTSWSPQRKTNLFRRQSELSTVKLSTLNVDAVCNLLKNMEEIQPSQLPQYLQVIQQNNINGRVLLHCDLDELKKILSMNFGDWELFKITIVSLRAQEMTLVSQQDELPGRNVRFNNNPSNRSQQTQPERRASNPNCKPNNGSSGSSNPTSQSDRANKQSVMEKQVTLEEQMICGALQTLNEEACEDVLEEADEQVIASLQVPSYDQSGPGGRMRSLSQSSYNSSICHDPNETDVILLQCSPVHPPYWAPCTVNQTFDSISCAGSFTETPILSRKQSLFDSKSENNQSKSRPSSLVMNNSSELEAILSPPFNASRSISIDSSYNKQMIHSQNNTKKINGGITPTLTITPAASMEQLSSTNQAMEPSDDESTPLVSNIPSPLSDSSSNCRTANQRVSTSNSQTVSELSSPVSIISSQSSKPNRGGEMCESHYDFFVYNERRDSDRSSENSPKKSYSLRRQDSLHGDSIEDIPWDPETSV